MNDTDKFREEFNKAAARKTNKWTDARNFQIFNTKYDQHLLTFKSDPNPLDETFGVVFL